MKVAGFAGNLVDDSAGRSYDEWRLNAGRSAKEGELRVMPDVILVCVGVLLIAHLVGLALLLRNQRWMSWPAESRQKSTSDVAVSVIVPARNEAEDIEQCLRSLLTQDHSNLKVICVNDHSDDETPQIDDRVAAEDSRLVVIHDPPLQPGWLGKHNAMQAALEHVSSELVLLTDADVMFEPTCISTAVAELEKHQLDLLSLYPQFEFVSFCETMLLPIYVGGAALLLSPAVENPKSRHAMAVGAFILVRAKRLNEIGGFEPIKAAILDDVCLAQTFKKHGYAIGLRSAPDLMHLRFFKNNRHAFFGVTKHLLGAVQPCIWLAPVLAIVPLLMYGTLLYGVIHGIINGPTLLAELSFLTLAIHYTALLLSRPGNRFNAIKALLFPCMSIQFAAACFRAIYLYLARGRFQWRGRDTRIREARDVTT
ncbi:MAG: glycosyltransferase [Planctomycetes bacterium]|nr:glycosyltransferase [Planctomycetota bacterium]MBL7040597.1 glycosyltransferase [Pirellulaceae bacterium]